MLARSLNDLTTSRTSQWKELKQADMTSQQRIWLLILNVIPLLHAGLVIALTLAPYANWFWRGLAVGTGLYVVPPLLGRLLRLFVTIPEGSIKIGTKEFFAWWTLLQLQMVFCRFPSLEEMLRLIPGLYSSWLRLWGACIGRLTYWSAGTLILDRPFLSVGDDVIFGAAVRLNAHVLLKNKQGQLELLLGTLKIGDRAIIGGYSLLTAGTEIAPDEATWPFLISRPFSSWKGGKRIK